MYGQIYTGIFDNVTVAATTPQDFFEITAPADAVVIILSWHLSQYGTSDVGDTEEELLDIETVAGRGATGGTGGTAAITCEPRQSGFAAAGSTVDINNTTRMTAGGGSIAILEKWGMNVRSPMSVIYTPEERPIISASDLWTLSLNTGAADAITMNGSVTFMEIGG